MREALVAVFTGLVADLGLIVDVEHSGDGVRLRVATGLAGALAEGDSVAVNGVCLTATAIAPGAGAEDDHGAGTAEGADTAEVAVTAEGADAGSFAADVMNETLRLTSLAEIAPGSTVNLELPMRPADRLGGHIVQGHVDGLGRVLDSQPDGFALRVRIEPPPELLRYIAHKGSIAVDGVSLTVAAIDDASFTVSLIPETLERTNLGDAQTGRTVNLEVDILAKYVERLIEK